MKEVVLLGQNVNSYYDQDTISSIQWQRELRSLRDEGEGSGDSTVIGTDGYRVAAGFTQRSRAKSPSKINRDVIGGIDETDQSIASLSEELDDKANESSTLNEGLGLGLGQDGESLTSGVRFAELLSLVAAVDPAGMRVRFQSPHPKDFPDEVLKLIAKTPNICNR